MGNNNEVVITDTDRLLLQKDEEVTNKTNMFNNFRFVLLKIAVCSVLL